MTKVQPGVRILDAILAAKDQNCQSMEELTAFLSPLLLDAAEKIRNDALAESTAELTSELAAAKKEVRRLERVLLTAQAKANLGAQAMDDDERGQNIAKGFKVIADFCENNIDPPLKN